MYYTDKTVNPVATEVSNTQLLLLEVLTKAKSPKGQKIYSRVLGITIIECSPSSLSFLYFSASIQQYIALLGAFMSMVHSYVSFFCLHTHHS